MNTLKSLKVALTTAGFAVAFSTLSCSRDHIEAINLANEGDQMVKVNVEGAIQKYEQANQLDPSNHRITWKLAQAYEKKEDWEKLAATLSRATQMAPQFANYWFTRGYALVKQAEAGNPANSVFVGRVPLKGPDTRTELHRCLLSIQGGGRPA